MPNQDPLQQWQWHLRLIGDIETIWRDYSGAGVHVGVYDDGIDFTHEDMAANYDASLHFVWQAVEQLPNQYAGHGTPVSGILGAVQGNGVGGTGVAWGVSMTGVTASEDVIPSAFQLAALGHASAFDIITNSWLKSVSFASEQSLADAGSYGSIETGKYALAAENGRGGLGTVVVQAAGNDFSNASGSAFGVSRFTITVGGTDPDGNIFDYSNFGSAILLAAPAAGVTTDVMGQLGVSGYNAPDALNYTYAFGGTSGATPIVAGVAALMLQANAGLGWRDVQNILANSAAQTGSTFGTSATGFEVGDWRSVGGTQWNGGGHALHQSYGYGMVDAYAAVRMAEAWGVLFGAARTSGNEVTQRANYTGPAVAIPDAVGNDSGVATITQTVTRHIDVETVYVTLDMTHANANNLYIALQAPDGTQVVLLSGAPDAGLMTDGLRWTFAVEGLRGYDSAGDWTLVVSDYTAGDTGRITDFDLQFFGAQTSVNDVYHFTDDFLLLAGVEGDRKLIDDANGGRDWLNFAAVHGDLRANLGDGGAISVNGRFWTRLDTAFENLFAGDGNDRITGNALANVIWGKRGNDVLWGMDGADKLVGGAGGDALYGGAGGDALMALSGRDTLSGGLGNDRLMGGTGADVFQFRAGTGRDRIVDFVDNVDTIQLGRYMLDGATTAAQVIARFASVVGGNTVLDFGIDRVTIVGLTNAQHLLNDISII